MKLSELKSLIQTCISELVDDSPDASYPKVKNAQKRVEVDKQRLEIEKQKAIDANIKLKKAERQTALDPVVKKTAEDTIKSLNNRKKASQAALVAARQTAASIK
jgi:hypothetical protein